MSIWSAMFNPDKRYEPNVERDAVWNRGAYLAEAMGHCGECHTPRNLAFALNNRQKFAGAVQAGWRAYNITPDRSSGVGAWSDADLLHYLSTGHADGRGTASGPMGEAVDASLRYLNPSDLSGDGGLFAHGAECCNGGPAGAASRSSPRHLRGGRRFAGRPAAAARFTKARVPGATGGRASARELSRQHSRVRAPSTMPPRPMSPRSSSTAVERQAERGRRTCRPLAARTRTMKSRVWRTT